MSDEEHIDRRPVTESEAAQEAARGVSALERLYPEKAKRDAFLTFVSRFKGNEPFWDEFVAAGVHFERARQIEERAIVHLKREELNGQSQFKWENVVSHPMLKSLEDLTVSMGGGKGRREGVELGKAAPPMPVKSRWSWRRHE